MAEAFRRYRTFCRNYGDNRLYCIAGGADVADYNWTEGVMKETAERFAGKDVSWTAYRFITTPSPTPGTIRKSYGI